MPTPKTQVAYGIVHGNKDLQRFANQPVPEPGPNQVLLKVEAAGLCRSDFHILLVQDPRIPKKMVMGHEICGSIAKIGPGLENSEIYQPGSRHSVVIMEACGTCDDCRQGRDNMCLECNYDSYGISQDGGFAEYVLIHSVRSLVPIPDNVSYAEAASATDAILTPFHAIMKVKKDLGPGVKVLVFGAGGLGLNAIQILSTFGCYIVVVDKKSGNEQLARDYGAAEFYTNPDDIPDGQEYFDVCADFVGKQETVDESVRYVKRGGKILMVGLGNAKVQIPNYDLARREVQIIFNLGGTSSDQAEILRWISMGVLRPLVKEVGMSELPEYIKKLGRGEIVGRVVFKPKL